MLIRTEQITTFEKAAHSRFEDEMVTHSKAFTPRLCEVLGDDQLRIVIRSAIEKAESYGFTKRGPTRLFIELVFLCGSSFDTDRQYPALGGALQAPGDEMLRAEQMHRESLDYLEKVFGPHSENLHRALKRLLDNVRQPAVFPRGFEAGMMEQMTRIFPEKATYIGESRLKGVIDDGIAESRGRRFTTTRNHALTVALMYSFGHRCTEDPLYPWIARTLADERIADPDARGQRLEQKAIIWLDHVVSRNDRLTP